MKWTKPRSVWQWLSLMVPALGAVLAVCLVTSFVPPPYFEIEGRQFMDPTATIRQYAAVSMGVIVALSLALAWPFAAGETKPERAQSAFGIFVCLFVVNSAVAFGGCTAAAFVSSMK